MLVRTTDTEDVQEGAQLRQQIARVLERRRELIINDACAVFPFAASHNLETADGSHLCALTLHLLLSGVQNGDVDSRSGAVADVRAFADEHGVGVRQLFVLVYLLERTALDEAALDETLGATSEQWLAVAQVVRHASFDCLAALTERATQESANSIIDPLTTVHTRAVLDAALEKEIRRAERFGHPFALVLLDVDRLSDLNARHGYGFGDRVLERIGIGMRSYFREHDWVARYGGDMFAVVLPETAPEHAELLAEQVRAMVQERLALQDHRTEEIVSVTASVAVLIAESVDSSVNAKQVLQQAEQAVGRAKAAGRNRVERIELKGTPDASTHEEQRRQRPEDA